ncbi:MAG: DUF2608 domain-containing protein [Alphaproteobacteria bacterium]|nr:DUF2608 domain-containing protein [Alphaproteobacteria bacterium]
MRYFKSKAIFLLFFTTITLDLNAIPFKRIIELKTINDIFSIIEHIKINYKKNIDEDAFEAQNTAFVFDIDGTITVEVKHILNQELVREQKDHAQIVADHFKIPISTFMTHIDRLWYKMNHEIQLVEKNTATFINNIQEKGYTAFTCTASEFVQNDQRLQLMKKENIDFSKSFMGLFRGAHFDFFSQFPEHTGHISARNSTKAQKIDVLIQEINDIREIIRLPKIENLIFIDNYKGEVEKVRKNCKNVKNIISFHYTYVKNHTSLDEIIADYQKYVRDCFIVESDSDESEEDDESEIDEEKCPKICINETLDRLDTLAIVALEEFSDQFSLENTKHFSKFTSHLEDLPQNMLHTFVIPVVYDDQTKEDSCLVKIGVEDKKNMLVFESVAAPKDMSRHIWLSEYLEKEGLGKFDLENHDLVRSNNFYDYNTKTGIYFLKGPQINVNEIENILYTKVPLFDFLLSIEYGLHIGIDENKREICPFFLRTAFSLIDEIKCLNYR